MKKTIALTAFLCAGIALCGCENKGNTTVTDISAVSSAASDSSITMEEAEQTAFADAGVSEADITHLKVNHNTEDGGNVFKVEFFDADNAYEYEISAETGNIVSKSIGPRSETVPNNSAAPVTEAETHPLDTTTVQPAVTESSTVSQAATENTAVSQTAMANTTASAAKNISEDEAKRIAFEDAGISESDAEYVSVKPDRDDGRKVFDVEFYAGGVEYDYEIDAENGRILSFDKDAEGLPARSETSGSGRISEAEAKEIAFADAGITESDAKRVKTEFDRDDGRELYEVEFYYNNMEYSYEINAADGSIIERDIDRD